MSGKKIIIPKGLVNPNETTIIEIPQAVVNEATLIARRSPVTPNSGGGARLSTPRTPLMPSPIGVPGGPRPATPIPGPFSPNFASSPTPMITRISSQTYLVNDSNTLTPQYSQYTRRSTSTPSRTVVSTTHYGTPSGQQYAAPNSQYGTPSYGYPSPIAVPGGPRPATPTPMLFDPMQASTPNSKVTRISSATYVVDGGLRDSSYIDSMMNSSCGGAVQYAAMGPGPMNQTYDLSSSLGLLGSGFLDTTRSSHPESSLGILGPGFLDTTRSSHPDSSLGILGPGYFDSTRSNHPDSSLGILGPGYFDSTRSSHPDSSLGILGQGYFDSTRSSHPDSSLGILGQGFLDSTRSSHPDSSLGILGPGYFDSTRSSHPDSSQVILGPGFFDTSRGPGFLDSTRSSHPDSYSMVDNSGRSDQSNYGAIGSSCLDNAMARSGNDTGLMGSGYVPTNVAPRRDSWSPQRMTDQPVSPQPRQQPRQQWAQPRSAHHGARMPGWTQDVREQVPQDDRIAPFAHPVARVRSRTRIPVMIGRDPWARQPQFERFVRAQPQAAARVPTPASEARAVRKTSRTTIQYDDSSWNDRSEYYEYDAAANRASTPYPARQGRRPDTPRVVAACHDASGQNRAAGPAVYQMNNSMDLWLQDNNAEEQLTQMEYAEQVLMEEELAKTQSVRRRLFDRD